MNDSDVIKIRESEVWKQNFKDWDDILDNGILKCSDIDQEDKVMISIMRSGQLVENLFNDFLKHFDLSISQQSILETLYFCNKKALNQNELAKWVYSSKANISTIITRMEEKGFVKRFNNPKSKREKLISITKKGELKIEQIFKAHADQKTSFFSEKDSKSLIKILEQFRTQIKMIRMRVEK